MTLDSFGSRDTLTVGGTEYAMYRLDRLQGTQRLPFALKVLAENLLRHEDSRLVPAEQIQTLVSWDPAARPGTEIQFTPARVLMQVFHWCAVLGGPRRDARGHGRPRPRSIRSSRSTW